MSENIEDREPLNTRNMLEEDFIRRLNGKIPVKTEKISINNELEKPIDNYNTEEIILNLFETRDELIEATKGRVDVPSYLISSINRIGTCINKMGGKIEHFDPFVKLSGLQAPSMKKNANRVIENTKESYSIGNISDTRMTEDGRTIFITFDGVSNKIAYRAVGTILASKTWVGNEAVDYIYTTGEGRMSVKALDDNGEWIDKSNNYKISWELYEGKFKDKEELEKEGNTAKETEIKEEVRDKTKKNNDEEDIGDFPIEEK